MLFTLTREQVSIKIEADNIEDLKWRLETVFGFTKVHHCDGETLCIHSASYDLEVKVS